MEYLTDIHCHILPGVDDGASNLDEAVRMLGISHAEGIENIILTPHFHGGRMQANSETVRNSFYKLKSACLENHELKRLNLYLGREIYYFPGVCDWLDDERLETLAGGNYVLLEFGFTSDLSIIKNGISSVANRGYIPVLAHAERYNKLVSSPKEVSDLINRGALIQINSSALVKSDGSVFFKSYKAKAFVKKLLKKRQVHFIATDAHDCDFRAPKLKFASEYIKKHYGEEYMKEIFIENPRKLWT